MKYNPVKLSPTFKDYLWGGVRLKNELYQECPLDRVAESWVLSAHKDGESVVCGGRFDGMTLSEYIDMIGRETLGQNSQKYDYFPLLIKFIDAEKPLSVQVHPSDVYALAHEGEYGKTEMWYVLDCQEDAFIYYGFSQDITKEMLEAAIKEGNLTDLLQKVKVKRGDAFFIPAGTVHAIGAGILICEVQQNSNTTYRVYDYHRKDKDGHMRPLHIDKALEVSNLHKSPELSQVPDEPDVLLSSCEYFEVRRLRVSGQHELNISEESFVSLLITDGCGRLSLDDDEIPFVMGDSLFIPAQNATCQILGQCEIMISKVN